ncbi:hypothetical protein B0H13DRAFT_1850576 [Mycena leptocephala]|nr:hypothetical protein B0H13DRAFT_1850576 [Mycena leptocephala]
MAGENPSPKSATELPDGDEPRLLRQVLLFITETQCLYNPAFQPTSHAQKGIEINRISYGKSDVWADVIIPGGILVPERSRITVALHSLAVNPENWEDPLTFDPDRRGTEDVCKRHKHACIPFALAGKIGLAERLGCSWIVHWWGGHQCLLRRLWALSNYDRLGYFDNHVDYKH